MELIYKYLFKRFISSKVLNEVFSRISSNEVSSRGAFDNLKIIIEVTVNFVNTH